MEHASWISYQNHPLQELERTRFRDAGLQHSGAYSDIQMLTGALSRSDFEAARPDAQRMLRGVPSSVVERHWNEDILDLIVWTAARTKQDVVRAISLYMLYSNPAQGRDAAKYEIHDRVDDLSNRDRKIGVPGC